jgi:formaldehyde-activating enzyme involved in methanogenesis
MGAKLRGCEEKRGGAESRIARGKYVGERQQQLRAQDSRRAQRGCVQKAVQKAMPKAVAEHKLQAKRQHQWVRIARAEHVVWCT